jgi:hypothetical protein
LLAAQAMKYVVFRYAGEFFNLPQTQLQIFTTQAQNPSTYSGPSSSTVHDNSMASWALAQ